MAGWVVVGLGPGSQAAEAQPLGLVPGWHVGLFLAGCPPGEPSSHPPTGLPPQALVLLQLWANLDVLLVASWQELSQHVCAFTKALAQHPFKCVAPTPARRVTGTLGGVVPPSLCGAEG